MGWIFWKKREFKNIKHSRDYFRWDERHHQPHTDMGKLGKLWEGRKDLAAYLELARLIKKDWGNITAAVADNSRIATEHNLTIKDLSGVGITPIDRYLQQIVEGIETLGITNVLVRMYRWEADRLARYKPLLEALSALGCDITISCIQDRQAVLKPRVFGEFFRALIDAFGDKCYRFEIGHAPNRKKWGCWVYDEYLPLFNEAAKVARENADRKVKLLAPAVIDFEYYFTYGILRHLSPGELDAVTHLLYVDRRGMPENKQYFRFDLMEKLHLLRSICNAAGFEHPLWITEMNWPVKAPRQYSPADPRLQINEELSAAYLLRYLLIAWASGYVDKVFWWQLISKGVGLMDDHNGAFRRRPAFSILRHLMHTLKDARPVTYRRDGKEHVVIIEHPSYGRCEICWLTKGVKLLEARHYKKVIELVPRKETDEKIDSLCERPILLIP